MRVLSLFDGISTAQYCLKELGIDVPEYFSSEIDKYAIQVVMENFPNTIQLGDIKGLTRYSVGRKKIDLMIGGFPCQSFSRGGKRLGWEDDRGQLFWELHRMHTQIQPTWFLYENSGGMTNQIKENIDEALGVCGVKLNSADFSAQVRERYYWFNWDLPQHDPVVDRIEDIQIAGWENEWHELDKYSEKVQARILRNLRSKEDKALTLCTNSRALGSNGATVLEHPYRPGQYRVLNRYECELLQGLPIGYTDVLSKTQAIKCLGNGFNAPTITHILQHIPDGETRS